MAYSLISRSPLEGPEESKALEAAAVSVVASAVLAFGALSGKYANPDASGRLAGKLDEPFVRQAVAAAGPLAELAKRFDTTPAALAIAFALGGPGVASVLFGATSAEQVLENARALNVDPAVLPELRRIGTNLNKS